MTFREILRQRIDTFISSRYGAPANVTVTNMPPPEEVITPPPPTGTLSTRGAREGAFSMHSYITPSKRLSPEEHFKILARTAIHKERMSGTILLAPDGVKPRSGVLSINKR